MTKNEYRICKTLAKNSELTFSKDHIYENIYDLDKDTQIKTISEYIYSIRKKCKEVAVNPIKQYGGLVIAGITKSVVHNSILLDRIIIVLFEGLPSVLRGCSE